MKKYFILLFIFSTLLLFSQNVNFIVEDNPNDDGSALLIRWDLQDDYSYMIEKAEVGKNFEPFAKLEAKSGSIVDGENIDPAKNFQYKLLAYDSNNQIVKTTIVKAQSSAQWFNSNKISLLILALFLSIGITYYIVTAQSGKDLYIRKIAGLDSIDESVGRATEMGRPILYIPGTLDLDDMQTIAGLTLLGRLAQKVAEYDAKLIVPVCRSMVLSTAKEIVKEAYLKAGRPDAYNPDSVFYLTDDQFGFVAGVDGIIVREKPAANFFLGAFYAESLILAETGFASGAIQTAGTAMPSQLPFFVVACDYTLIGEELYAASAYLSKNPHQLGSLKGQDLGKALFMFLLAVGVILEIANISILKDFLTNH